MASNDPKHGRWILPLIITGMVLLTFTFVNSLEPTDSVEETTTTTEPPFPTTPTSSTTTLPPDLAAFMVTVDVFDEQAAGFGQQIVDINNDWEARSILFGEARTKFSNVKETVDLWEEQVVEAAADAPAALAETYVAFITEVEQLAPAIEDIVLGLEAPDDGALRRTAIDIYSQEVQEVLDAITAIRAAAAAEVPEGSEGAEGSEGSETTEGTETTDSGDNA